MNIPDGFSPHFKQSSLTAPWEPIYSKTLQDRVQIGLNSTDAHTNSRGFVHGGLLTALADNAMGLSCAIQYKDKRNILTMHLGIDFLSVARTNQWLLFDTSFSKIGGHVCFTECFIYADSLVVAKANGVFKS